MYKLYRIFRFFATKTARIRSTVKVKITKFIQPIWFKKIGVYLSWMLSKNMPQNWKIFFTLSQKSFHGHFCQKTARNHLKTLVLWPKSWKTVVLEFVPEKYWRVLLVLYFVPEKNRRSTSTWYFCTWNENRFEVQPWLSYVYIRNSNNLRCSEFLINRGQKMVTDTEPKYPFLHQYAQWYFFFMSQVFPVTINNDTILPLI